MFCARHGKRWERARWDELRSSASVKCEECNVKSGAWRVQCEVWSVKSGVLRAQCEVKCGVRRVQWSVKRGVKREVLSVKSAVRNMKCEVELQMWHEKQDPTFAECTHARAWLAHGTCKFYRWERSYVSLRQLPPRLVRVLLVDIFTTNSY